MLLYFHVYKSKNCWTDLTSKVIIETGKGGHEDHLRDIICSYLIFLLIKYYISTAIYFVKDKCRKAERRSQLRKYWMTKNVTIMLSSYRLFSIYYQIWSWNNTVVNEFSSFLIFLFMPVLCIHHAFWHTFGWFPM